jgi:GT2 family glycosyltransferase/glycosyltransferase involved in cell wall biosynthesis
LTTHLEKEKEFVLKSSIPGLQSLVLANGYFYAALSKTANTENLFLDIGNETAPFSDCDHDPIKSPTRWDASKAPLNAIAIDSDRSDTDVFECQVNKLEDWTLSGQDTVQLQILDRENSQKILFKNPLIVPASEATMVLRAKLASHRARAKLCLTVVDPKTGAENDIKVAIDAAFRGGREPDGYQQVSVPLPTLKKPYDILLSIEYDAFRDEGIDSNPFLFFSDIKVEPDHTKTNAFFEPIVFLDNPTYEKCVWKIVPLHAFIAPRDSSTASIRLGQSERSIPLLDFPKIDLLEDYGHTLILQASAPQDTVLYIDGTPVKECHVSADASILRVPRKYLDGTTRHLSLKDKSGSIILFESIQLLPAIMTPADVMQRETAHSFPLSLFAQTPHRYEALKASLAHANNSTDLPQLAYALSVLEGGYDNVTLRPLKFPKVNGPDVSIIIPAHNKVEVTYLALCSLLVAYNDASFEVILVDDASTDETAEIEKIVSGITVIHNSQPQRFIRSCNAGAEKAKGKFIVLLNNDVEVTTGWLDELIASFDRFDNVGLAGSKLLYPDGRLQDAGGIIWGSGNPWNYGNSQNPNDPRFSYARQADYLSGAAMMVPTELWKQMGGLSSYLEPMYFEDTDFAFKIRDAGYSTWFVPSSVVYHYEGMTSGTDTSTGFKRYQEVNRPKFKRQWAKAYAGFSKDGHKPDLEKDRGIVGRVLFLDYTTPRPDQDAGSYAALQEIKMVQSLGYKVSFLPMNMAHLGRYTDDLQKLGVEMIYAPFFMTPGEYLEKHAAEFDAFYITRYYVAQQALTQLRTLAPEAKVIFNNADLHFLREIRAARSEDNPGMLEKARQTRNDELEIINQVDVVLSYNETEHSVIQAYTDGQATVRKCPWVVEPTENVPEFEVREGLSFLGGFLHHPNKEGVLWFVREIMPLLSSQGPNGVLSIYGSKMDEEIKALKSDTVHPVGFVEQIADAYDRHRIFVAPLRSGAGIKGKVLSALAHGIPCVLTPTAAEGIGLRSGHDCFIAETPTDWVTAIEQLNTDKALWEKISANAQAYMADAFSFNRGRLLMRDAFEAAEMYQSLD